MPGRGTGTARATDYLLTCVRVQVERRPANHGGETRPAGRLLTYSLRDLTTLLTVLRRIAGWTRRWAGMKGRFHSLGGAMPDFEKLEQEAEAKAKQEAPALEKKYETELEADGKSEEEKLREKF